MVTGRWASRRQRQQSGRTGVCSGVGHDERIGITPTRLAGIPVHDLLRLAGRLAGLEAWAWWDERCTLTALHQLCLQQEIPLVVLGPSANLCTPGLRALC